MLECLANIWMVYVVRCFKQVNDLSDGCTPFILGSDTAVCHGFRHCWCYVVQPVAPHNTRLNIKTKNY